MLTLFRALQLVRGRQQPRSNGVRVIYCYHGLVQAREDERLERNFHLRADFKQQIRWLNRSHLVSLSELAANLKGGPRFGQSMAAITFDDGYANNLVAAEILAEARLPWAIFVSSSAVGSNTTIWTVELSLLLLHGQCQLLEALGQKWQLHTRGHREQAFQAIRYSLKAMPASMRQENMRVIRMQFPASETERLLEQFPSFRMLTWPELRQLAEAGIEIGSHGVDHEHHHSIQDPVIRRRELVQSKQEIERQLGKPCRFFAFPNGDCCQHSADEVEAAGYELAFTTRQSSFQPDSNRFLLPRVSPGGSLAKLKKQLKELR